MLRYVNDDSRTLYAFEMLPAPSISDVITSSDDIINNSTPPQCTTGSDSASILPNNAVSSSSTVSTAPADSSSQVTDMFSKPQANYRADLNIDNNIAACSSSDQQQQQHEVLNNSLCSNVVSTSHSNLEFR